jgi:hypothetical protein
MNNPTSDENAAVIAVAFELSRARERHGDFHSPHGALVSIEVAFEDLRRHIYRTEIFDGYTKKIREKAIWLAVMAVRMVEDICDNESTSHLRPEIVHSDRAPADWVSPWPETIPAADYTEPASPPISNTHQCCEPVDGGACARKFGHPGSHNRYMDCGQVNDIDCVLAHGHESADHLPLSAWEAYQSLADDRI